MRAILRIADSVVSAAPIVVRGKRRPYDFLWNAELQAHILDGRVFDLTSDPERLEFNAAARDLGQMFHTECYPIAEILPKVMVVDAVPPLEVTDRFVPAPEPMPPFQNQNVPMPISAKARRLAEDNGIDVSKIKGSGTMGMITIEDVRRAVAEKSPDPILSETGIDPAPVRMKDVLKEVGA